jgi:hypothetical protein
MNRLSPRERAAIIKRVKKLTAKIQDPNLPLEELETLHRERGVLHAQLLDDRAASYQKEAVGTGL